MMVFVKPSTSLLRFSLLGIFSSLIRAVETQPSVILSVVASEKTSFLHIFKSVFGEQCDFLARRIRETLEVMPLTDGGLTADFSK